MTISPEQVACAQKHLRQIRRQYLNDNSKVADWWNKLRPEWRSVVLHAAALCTNRGVYQAHLSKCSWRELHDRLDYRAMIGLKRGISTARQIFEGFGALPDSDFSSRTASRPDKRKNPIYGSGAVQMVVAPNIVRQMQSQHGDAQ